MKAHVAEHGGGADTLLTRKGKERKCNERLDCAHGEVHSDGMGNAAMEQWEYCDACNLSSKPEIRPVRAKKLPAY